MDRPLPDSLLSVFCGLHEGRKNISTGLAQNVVSVLFTRTSKVELALFERVEVGEGGVDEICSEAHVGLDLGDSPMHCLRRGFRAEFAQKHGITTSEPEVADQGGLGWSR